MLVVVIAVRTARFASQQVVTAPSAEVRIDTLAAARRLAAVVRLPTVSRRPTTPGEAARLDTAAFRALHDTLRARFPRVHARLRRDVVGQFGLLFAWPGRDTARAPLLLLGHTDVVPAPDADAWTHPPFAGTVADGYVWGRGTLDDKASAVGLLEAAESLLAEGYRPARTIYLALGHDEEVGGKDGAVQMAEVLRRRGVRPLLIADEGGAITHGAVPGLARPVALVGVAEKGYLSLALDAEAPGGHSAMPPDTTSIELVAEAVRRLRAAPLPARLDGVAGRTFDFLAPEMPLAARAVFANRWLTRPALRYALSRRAVTEAAIRTTTAPTVLRAGQKDNVVPTRAHAVVNFRLLPGDTVADVEAHVRGVLSGLPVTVRRLQHSDATPVSATRGAVFRAFQRTIQEATPDTVVVAPYLVPGATDARHYADLSDHVFRFLPFRLTEADRSRIHGRDERIALADYAAIVAFYQRLMRNIDALADDEEHARRDTDDIATPVDSPLLDGPL